MSQEKAKFGIGDAILVAFIVLVIGGGGFGGYWFFIGSPAAKNNWAKFETSTFGQQTLVTYYSDGKIVRAWKVLHGKVQEESGAGHEFSCNGGFVQVPPSISEPLKEAPALPPDVPVIVCN
jgi:hypothetical protein